MKNSKEMADSVFKIRDFYLEKQRKRKRKLIKVAYIGSSVCIFGLTFMSIYFIVPNRQQILTITVPDVLENTSLSDMSENEIKDTNKVNEMIPTNSTSPEVEMQKSSDEFVETRNHFATENSQIEAEVSQATENEPIQEEIIPSSDNNIEETISPTLDRKEIIPPADSNIKEMISPTLDREEIISPADSNIKETISSAFDVQETLSPSDKSDGFTEENAENIIFDPNEFDIWTLEDIYCSFPQISFEKQYYCLNITITEDMLELAIADITVTGINLNTGDSISADVIVYSFIDSAENDEIAIWFKDRNDYIVYRAEEIE
ncbi:MAG: hypothetical protein K2H29_00785 [Oscillospiraceae bacterium]|nr:hypothetical protein [Oscillospiraceae bacterium]MDE5883610.1 hypothetical protein [Oscillospiraceae bacterium]